MNSIKRNVFILQPNLLKQWNKQSGQEKQMVHFLNNKSTKEFIDTLSEELNSKERNHVIIKSRDKGGGTWMHPYLFIDFAMWLNPSFKVKVIQRMNWWRFWKI